MCNIAGYVGPRRAAPILIDMLREEEAYDGGGCTGIATVHEGKLHYRKFAGNIDRFLKETDALDLPGNIGIIHSKPGSNPPSFAHPHISEGGSLAVVMNGTLKRGDKYTERRDSAARLTEERGYEYAAKNYDGGINYAALKDGAHIPAGEMAAHLTAMFHSDGLDYTEAFARAIDAGFTDYVGVMLTANDPDKIRVCKVSRPMSIMMGDGEMFIASTPIAFKNQPKGNIFALPALQICEITKDALTVTGRHINVEEVAPITPETYVKAAEIMLPYLKAAKEKKGVFFDSLELLLGEHKEELFEGNHTYTPHPEVVYHILYELENKGLLNSEYRNVPGQELVRKYMWID